VRWTCDRAHGLRVSALDLHLDTDEANALGLGDASVVALAGVERRQ